jgi:hypothetical protein
MKYLDDEEDDDRLYDLTGGSAPICPHCSNGLEPGSVLCVRCGYHLEKREKVSKTHKPIHKHWVSGWPYRQRLTAFLFASAAAFLLGLPAALIDGTFLYLLLWSWPPFVLLMAFMLGTFEEIDFTRDKKGKIRLTKQWTFMLIRQPPFPISVAGFERVESGKYNDAGCFTWVIFILLLLSGILPGLLWWYFVIKLDWFFVALCKDHGYPELLLYRGWDEDKTRDITGTLRQAVFSEQ